MGTEVKQTYGIKVSTILNATEKLTEDLEYLCSLVEKADPEFKIKNAIAYSHAVMILSNHLDFVLEEITKRDLTPDEEMVKITVIISIIHIFYSTRLVLGDIFVILSW